MQSLPVDEEYANTVHEEKPKCILVCDPCKWKVPRIRCAICERFNGAMKSDEKRENCVWKNLRDVVHLKSNPANVLFVTAEYLFIGSTANGKLPWQCDITGYSIDCIVATLRTPLVIDGHMVP
uniref:Uncharacterized protein n=1 Tax=Trichuris muris TaxID=70415 RepID=A0A5S6Q231_TRIMR